MFSSALPGALSLTKSDDCFVGAGVGRSFLRFTRQIRVAHKVCTRAGVQATDFTFPGEEGGSLPLLSSFFFLSYTGKVRENRESASEVLKVARAPDMHRGFFYRGTRDNASFSFRDCH